MNLPTLCLALDMPHKSQNLALCENLAFHNLTDLYLKVGLRSFIRDGIDFIEQLKTFGFRIFLDLKLYDIPNTMLDSLDEIIKLNIDILTIHASSGRVAMESVARRLSNIDNPPLVFAVTALTSFSEEGFREIYNAKLDCSVIELAKITSECGINGVVCAPLESKLIKSKFDLLTLTPGIRPCSDDFIGENVELYNSNDDQNRATSLKSALEQDVDFIVIGRPIYKHNNPVFITQKILSMLNKAAL